MSLDHYIRLGLALAIGLLVGLQRERAKEGSPTGIRTFALISLSGFVVGMLAVRFDAWLAAAGIVFLGAVLTAGNVIAANRGRIGTGTTTEVAALLVFGIGVFLAHPEGDESMAVVIAGVAALLLYYKRPMHRFVAGMSEGDVHAIMQFVLITLVILPVLPNRTYGPFDVLNPFQAWLMVVLIVGIGLTGYVFYQFVGAKAGTLLSGFLGGAVSSTATTAAAARQSRAQPSRTVAATLIIVLASVVSIVRVLVEIAVVSPGDFAGAAPPIGVFLLVFLCLAAVLYRRSSSDDLHLDPPGNPAELKPAILFGLFYAVILVGVAAAREYFGQAGLYGVAALSGLPDINAITLSTAELMRKDDMDTPTGWRVILVALLANLIFKGGVAGFLGNRRLLGCVALYYAIALAAGLAIFFLWPEWTRRAASEQIDLPATDAPGVMEQ